MSSYSVDIRYAYIQLGLRHGATSDDVQRVLADAVAYPFNMRARVDHVRRFVTFFAERQKLGGGELPFAEIRKIYHRKAMALHPDTQSGNRAAEEELKTINAAYETVDDIYREAKAYFEKDDAAQRAIEQECRAATEKERAAAYRDKPEVRAEEDAAETPETRSPPSGADDAEPAVKYLAASIPRYIRVSRLFYLPLHAIIGSRLVKHPGSQGMVYDVVMLPEREFRRARLNLAIEGGGAPELRMSKLTPAYVPLDTKELRVPVTEPQPYKYAKAWFIKKFGLPQSL